MWMIQSRFEVKIYINIQFYLYFLFTRKINHRNQRRVDKYPKKLLLNKHMSKISVTQINTQIKKSITVI